MTKNLKLQFVTASQDCIENRRGRFEFGKCAQKDPVGVAEETAVIKLIEKTIYPVGRLAYSF